MQTQNLTGYPSIDKPWLKYYSEEERRAPLPECTVYRSIYENNKDHPSDIAIRYFGKAVHYGQLFQSIDLCAKALKQIGIKKGSCVTLCTAAVPEAIYLVLACSKIGAVANFMNPLFSTEQMIARVNDTEAEWIFILDRMYSYIEAALSRTCVKNVVIIPVYESMPSITRAFVRLRSRKYHNLKPNGKLLLRWPDFLALGNLYTGKVEEAYQKDVPVIMVYSSGSTGASKGILLTNDGINATIAFYHSASFRHLRGETFLQLVPVWFSTGIVLEILMPLSAGITVIPEPIFSKETFVRDLKRYKPNMTLTTPTHWLYAVDSKRLKHIDLSHMNYPITGGERLLPFDEKRINAFLTDHKCKANIIKGYGMCELGSTVATSRDSEKYISKFGGNGLPILNVSVSAFDMTTNKELKSGECGEIRVNSPARMKEYYKNKNATNAFFYTDENGSIWACTGDIGYVDQDGEVFILGRATDCATLDNGKKVFLFDIENRILQDESLSGCKVVDVQENGKTTLIAHITVRAGVIYDDHKLAQKIYDHCKKHLCDEEVPRKYKFRTSFPAHSNGKRDIAALKQEKEGFIEIVE